MKQLPVALLVTTDKLYSTYITKDLPVHRILSSLLSPLVLLIDSTSHFVYSSPHPLPSPVLSPYHTSLLHSPFLTSPLILLLTCSCTSGSVSSRLFVFHSPAGILTRWQWMRSILTQHSITSIATFAATHFIDCMTCLLDALFFHVTWVTCPPAVSSSLLRTQPISLLRCTPSFLLSLSHQQPITNSLLVHLSGELLHSSTLLHLRSFLPQAHFVNVYGGNRLTPSLP